MKLQPVTISQIAEKLGVNPSTVSRALRQDPRISEEMRQKVRQKAEELGYKPNALVSLYQAHVRSVRPVEATAALAWIDDHPQEGAWHWVPWLRDYLDGARQRAELHGFKLEVLRVEELKAYSPELDTARISKVLEARGIHGAILPMVEHVALLTANWNCAVVEIGSRQTAIEHMTSRHGAVLRRWHKVAPDYYHNLILAVKQCLARGYSRPGLFISSWLDRHTNWLLHAGMLVAQSILPKSSAVPPLVTHTMSDVRRLRAWLKKFRPDCVICAHGGVRKLLEQAGRKVPDDIGLVHLNIAADVASWSGVEELHPEIGSAAVDALVGQLRCNQRGEPEAGRHVYVPGRWHEGETLPQKTASHLPSTRKTTPSQQKLTKKTNLAESSTANESTDGVA